MTQSIHELSSEEITRLEAQRKWVREHYEPAAQKNYETVKGKVRLIAAIIGNAWIEPHETIKLQSLGVSLGDAIAQELGLEWVAVEDEFGRDPALILRGTSIKIFPVTMISKRIERGEQVDAVEMFGNTCKTILEIKREGA